MSRLPTLLAAGLAATLVAACPCENVRRQIDVDILWVGQRGKQVIEGTSHTEVHLEPNRRDKIRVGVIEGTSLQAGSTWRSSVWMAAFQAAMAVNQDLMDWLVAVEVDTGSERIDGPSAGGLLTAAMMAGMTGAPVKSAFTMSGTINPDGTIGPVGGLPHKFAAAVAIGKKSLAFPVGQRYGIDMRSKKRVDLKTAFKPKGVEVVEVNDVYQAYQLLTGRRLARPTPVEPSQMDLPEPVYKAMEGASRLWLDSVKGSYDKYVATKVQSPLLAKRWEWIHLAYRMADKYLMQGMAAAAYHRSAQLFVQADAVLQMAKLLTWVQNGKFEDAAKYVKRATPGVEARIKKALDRLRKHQPRSTSDVLSMVDSLAALNASFRALKESALTHGPAVARLLAKFKEMKATNTPLDNVSSNEIVDILVEPLWNLIISNVQAIQADMKLAFRSKEPLDRVDPAALERIADLLGTAASSNFAYFEATTLSRLGRQAGISDDQARRRFPDRAYQRARLLPLVVGSNVTPLLKKHAMAANGARLAGAIDVYIEAALLIAKYYSLRFQTNERGDFTGVEKEKSFINMLATAERMAREHAARALKATGSIPVPAQIAYQIGRAYRDGASPAEKIVGLEQFWRSSLFSQLAVMLKTKRRFAKEDEG